MKVILALFVVGLSLLGFADDVVGGFDAASVLQSSVMPLISGFVVALGSLLVAASAIYLAYLGWRKYQEGVAVVNHDQFIDDQACLTEDEFAEKYGYLPELSDDDLSADPVDCPCDDGSPCPHTDECVYWAGSRCDIGLE